MHQEKRYERYKRFDLDRTEEQRPSRPSLGMLALELASIIGETKQKEFSRSLDWTAPTLTLIEAYQNKIGAERQLLIDNQTPPEVDAWFGDVNEADDAAVLADVYSGFPRPAVPCTLANDLRSSL